jgi:hypothetical protein
MSARGGYFTRNRHSAALNYVAGTIGAVLNDVALNVKMFPWLAKGDGVTDDSAAIQAAENAAAAAGAATGRYPVLRFPVGDYRCNSLQYNKVVSWIGPEVGSARLVYNGPDNVADSYIVGLVAGAGAVPYSGFYNLTFVGFDATGTAGPACAHAIHNLGTNLDWGFKLQNLQFQNFYDDALQLRGAASVFVNLFLHRLRFDGVGGFAIYIGSNNVNSGSPFVLDDFTLDNNLSANAITKMTAIGKYDGARWGKGLLRLEDGQGVAAHIANARIELNRKLIAHNGGYGLIYSNQTIAGTRCFINAQNLQGTARQDQTVMFLRDVTGRTTFRHADIGMSNLAKLVDCPASPERDVFHNMTNPGFSASLLTQQIGLHVGGHTLEWRPNPPEQVAGNFSSYKFGDLVFNTTLGAGRPVIWQAKFPTTGFAIGAANQITAAAVVTAGSATVGVPSTTFANLAPGLAITLVGAGAAGASLNTRVTAADEVAGTITVADVPATSVNPATINFKPAEFAPVLYQAGVSPDRGSADVALTLGVDAPTQIFNSPLGAVKTVTFAAPSAANVGSSSLVTGKFRIVRTAAATGASVLNVIHAAGTKALAAGQWAECERDSTGAWTLTAAGSL